MDSGEWMMSPANPMNPVSPLNPANQNWDDTPYHHSGDCGSGGAVVGLIGLGVILWLMRYFFYALFLTIIGKNKGNG